MIRRALAGLFAAALLVLAPSAAFGYADDDFAMTASTMNPAPGEPFTVTVTAPTGTGVVLTISSDAPTWNDEILVADAVDGQAVFTVTLDDAGTYTLTAMTNDGTLIDTITVVVGAGAGDDATTPPPGDGAPAPAPGDGAAPGLPETGATATPIIIGATVLLLVGGAALFFARRSKVSA